MILQGRNLEPNMRGDDVRLLQDELRQLGFNIVGQEGFFGSTTFLAVQQFQQQHNLPATGIVDAQTARVINAALDAQPREGYLVKGKVVNSDGRPFARASVVLFEKRLRSEQRLGETRSNPQGVFEITYPQPEETPLSVLVRAFRLNGPEIATSDLICDVKPVEEVTLVVGGEALQGPSEYGQLDNVLRPALAAEQLNPADLNEEDVSFLSCKFQLNPEHVALFVVSARHHRDTEIVAEGFYGLLRQGLPTELTSLVAQSQETLGEALETSVEKNIISSRLQSSIPRILQSLQDQIVRLALRNPEPDRPTFTALFDIARVESSHRQRILEDYVNREGTVEEYWQRLRDDPAIPNEQLDELQETLKLSAIALNHVDLVSHITRLRRAGTIGPHLRDLSRLQTADWNELLNSEVSGRRIGAPEFFGDDERERINRYAAFLPRMVESIFPTAVLTHRLAGIDDNEFDFRPALTFLNRNPDFEFRNTPVQAYLDDHPDALVGVPDREATVVTLKSMQRLFEIAPAFNKAQAVATLMARRLDSATAIRRMGATQFIRQNQEALGFDGAQEMYTRAARKADTALVLLSQSLVFNPTNPAIIAPHLVGQGVPDLEALFGSLDLCKCTDCNSVYSPAAYLVDILHYLMNRPTVSGGRTALDVLFDRRPDLGEIELNCHNTNTMLPYVDLVVEILEAAVVGGGRLTVADEDDEDRLFPFQTTGDAEALGANPEHLNGQAYTILGNARYPWLLPFDLWHSEVRTYLNHLGAPLDSLISQFNFGEPSGSQPAFAAEYLGLTALEREIITDAEDDPLHRLWGFDNQGELNQFVSNRNAAQLLDRSGLTYEELTSLLDVPYINPSGNLRIRFEGTDCILENATIANLNSGALDRIHRFVRLWRRQSWSIDELGAILETLNSDDLNDAVLGQLATITKLHSELKAPLPILLNWLVDEMATVGSNNQPSFYEQIFLDPTVHKPELAIFELNEARDDLADTSASLNDHVPIIYSALGISAADLVLLIETELTNSSLNISNLTRLYQAVSLSKKLRLSIPEYVSMRGLSGITPFGVGAIDRTMQFVGLAQRAQSAPFTIPQIDYLLRHQEQDSAEVSPTDEQITAILVELRTGLYQISSDHVLPESSDAILQMIENRLALMLPADVVSQILAVVNRTSNQSQDDQIALIQEHLSLFLDPADLVAAWFDEDEGEDGAAAERAEAVLAPLLQHLRRIASQNLVVQTIASALGIELLVAEKLLRTFVTIPDGVEPALDLFLADGFAPPVSENGQPPDFQATTGPDQFPQHYAIYHRLCKVAFVLETLKVPADKIEFFFTNGVAAGWPDLNALPLEPVEQPVTELNSFLNTAELFQVAGTLFGDLTTLFDLLRTLDNVETERTGFLESVASQSGWEIRDVDFLTGSSALDISFPDGFRDGLFLVQLRSRFQLLRKLAVSAEAVRQWATEPVTEDTARGVKQAARARYEDKSQWLAVAKPLRDELRERQRAALVAHLVHTIRIQVPRFEQSQPTLSVGDRRPAVQELQLKLNMAGAIPPLKVDGMFGPQTRQAVRDFQEANNLDDNGTVGPTTWAALNEVNRHLRGPNELYAHFLIDVEMDPCMLTSRIVLANSSVQLFVQRCLLNLEPEVELAPEDAKEWEWMKQYRIWEANRKVFLYPENWIYPELRNDKTPLFRELESGLLQDELNDITVEREYLKYLNGLNQVAQLEISGIYRQGESDRDVLHVFGRTHNTPHIYFYRQWVDRQYWTPWERVAVDIEGDHLVPVVWNRRLYLFWPIFMIKAQEAISSQEPPPPAKRFYEIRLAWSEYREGRWGPKTVSNTAFTTEPGINLPDTDDFSFWSYFGENQELYIAYELADQKGQILEESINHRQFRIVANDNGVGVTSRGSVNSSAPPGTRGEYNTFSEVGSKSLRLVTSAIQGESYIVPFSFTLPAIPTEDGGVQGGGGGGIVEFVSENILKLSGPILRKTPGSFRLMLAHNERPHRSQTPLFYGDDTRTFFVIPEGKYAGGFAQPDFPLGLTPETTHSPIELPDIATYTVASFMINERRKQTNTSVTVVSPTPPSNPAAPSANPATLVLNPSLLFAHVFTPLYWEAKEFQFDCHYHPYVGLLVEELNRYGIDGMLKPDAEKEKSAQRKNIVKSLRRQKRTSVFFASTYDPNDDVVAEPGPKEEFEFDNGGAYSVYNWELFFHAPLMLAKRLSDNQRFAEAHRWFHYIFDPTYRAANSIAENWPERVWQIKPFFEQGVGQSIQRTMLLLKSSGLTAEEEKERKNLRDQIEAWRKDPFNPHLIARMRPEAYMKTTVMAYLDNLVAWGDHLFRQDTMESINEATQLYILAAEILGDRPREIAPQENTVPTINGEEVKTFNDLRGRLDAFSNVLVELETRVEADATPGNSGGIGGLLGSSDLAVAVVEDGNDDVALDLPLASNNVEPPDDNPPVIDLPLALPIPAVMGPTLFFCIPKNDKLLGYWDEVEDRLFKIRHCMNIEGIIRQLPLFQPPIDPGLLVKAAAAGVDLASALNDLNAPLPCYRFQVMVQKANELINDVKGLGAALLGALEKRDAEELALLRSSHEVRIHQAVRRIKEKAIDEAKSNLDALKESRAITEARLGHYSKLIEDGLINKELNHLEKLESAFDLQTTSQALELLAGVLGLIPQFDAGVSGAFGTPVVKVEFGGAQLTTAIQVASRALQLASSIESYRANKASIEAGYDRRKQEWELQVTLAEKEIEQVDAQLAAAELRVAVAENDLEAHDVQIESAKEMEEFLRDKYTSPELYSWMLSETAGVYFQSYQLAYDLAKQAERASRYELGIEGSGGAGHIQFGYWDNLKKGLLAGEKLQADLRRLEVAYLEENRREYELTKHVSLAMLDPIALLRLKEEGRCEIELSESLFDIDYPNHYFRRIKSVSITIPAVTGPYTTLSCALRLLRSSVRRQSTLLNGQYARDQENSDPRFSDSFGAIQSIAISSGQNDSGLFDLSFRDERYLPFEGAGAISRWQLEMPNEFRQFDYDSISDVILHIKYTAREGGSAFGQASENNLLDGINALVSGDDAPGLHQAFSARHEFPTEFHRFLHPAGDSEQQRLIMNLAPNRFPYMFKRREINVDQVHLFVRLADSFIQPEDPGSEVSGTAFTLIHPGGERTVELDAAAPIGNTRQVTIDNVSSGPGEWRLTLSSVGEGLTGESNRLNPIAIEDIILILHYRIE